MKYGTEDDVTHSYNARPQDYCYKYAKKKNCCCSRQTWKKFCLEKFSIISQFFYNKIY